MCVCVCCVCVCVCVCVCESNSKTLILKDSSVYYLTASPWTGIKQLINAVSQFLLMCRNIRIKFLSWAYIQHSNL